MVKLLENFQKKLESNAGVKLQLKINDNRSTMLSVRWEPECTKVSLHRMFLQAPRHVMHALACYLRKEDKIISPQVRAFIENGLQELDYSHLLDPQKLYVQGNVYNLKHIYDAINREYFNNKLNLWITWFGKSASRNRRRVTFGLYHDPLRLIKINRILDTPSIPDYVVSYVVYHEMLHYVCPAYIDEKGLSRIHSKEFKHREEQFCYFDMAQNWIKKNQANLFADCY